MNIQKPNKHMHDYEKAKRWTIESIAKVFGLPKKYLSKYDR